MFFLVIFLLFVGVMLALYPVSLPGRGAELMYLPSVMLVQGIAWSLSYQISSLVSV